MASVPEVESEISLTTDLQKVSLAAGNSVFFILFKKTTSPVNTSPPAKERAGVHNPEPPLTNPQHWCVCGWCRPMQTPRENKCYGYRTCTTTFEDFHLICLEHSVLMVAIHNRADIMPIQ